MDIIYNDFEGTLVVALWLHLESWLVGAKPSVHKVMNYNSGVSV